LIIPLNAKSNIIILILLLILSLSVCGQVQLEPACAESVQQYGVEGYESSLFWWYFDHQYGRIIEGDGTDTVTIQWYYPTGTVQLEVIEVTIAGCSNVPSRATIEIMAPDVNLGDDFPEICDEDTLVLDPGDDFQEPYTFLWNDGSTNQEYVAASTELIWVEVTDGYGCSRFDTVSLLVHPLPHINLGNDTIYCDQNMPLALDPGDFASYSWISSSGTESSGSIFYAHAASFIPDTIILDVTDFNSCPASDTLVLIPCDFEALFRDMPNMITPDGNGQNDVWNIPYMQFFDDAVLEVFDRWGRLVYRTTSVLEEPWDGTSNGKPLPMDAYYFVLSLGVMDAPPIVGTVNIIR
jgi:gliding motility-associated-like protein